MVPVWSRQQCSNGLSYHYAGSGEPLVLLHGVGLRAECWSQQLDELAQHHAVYLFDLPGHGSSASLDDPQNAQIDDLALAIVLSIRELNIPPAVIIGHSLGALIALHIALHHVDVCRGVVPLSTVFERPEEAKSAVRARADELRRDHGDNDAMSPLARWFGAAPVGDLALYASWCSHWLQQGDRQGYATAYRIFAYHDGMSTAQISSLTLPALFVTGAEDPNSNAAMSQRMAELAPLGEVLIVERAKHMFLLTHAHSLNKALLKFAHHCTIEQSKPTTR